MKHSAMQYILGTSCWMCLRVMQGILGTSCWVKHCHAGHLRHVLNESPYHAWHHRDVTLSETPRHAGHLRHVMLSETTCVPCKNLWHIMFETQYHEERLRQVVLSETPSHADSDIFSTCRVGGKKNSDICWRLANSFTLTMVCMKHLRVVTACFYHQKHTLLFIILSLLLNVFFFANRRVDLSCVFF